MRYAKNVHFQKYLQENKYFSTQQVQGQGIFGIEMPASAQSDSTRVHVI